MTLHVVSASKVTGGILDVMITGSAERKWMSTREAAEHTGFSENTIRKAIRSGALRALRQGERNFKILPNDLDAWAETLVYKPE